jgi:hypothetical protein
MNKRLIKNFPAKTHSLILVSDPDNLLSGERILFELTQDGFLLIKDSDPVSLRQSVEEKKPITVDNPIILVSGGPLTNIPYDLYQQAHKVTLSLHQFFPRLSYPVLQVLSTEQIEKLGECDPPHNTLSRQKTVEYLLQEVFLVDFSNLCKPHALINWLSDYHKRHSLLPDLLRKELVNRIESCFDFKNWNIDLLIMDQQACFDFLQQSWKYAVNRSMGEHNTKEPRPEYFLDFNSDLVLQDLVPILIRKGVIQSVQIKEKLSLPEWIKPGITLLDDRIQRYIHLLDEINQMIMITPPDGWKSWKEIAYLWAEASLLFNDKEIKFNENEVGLYRRISVEIDRLFTAWIGSNYSPLGVQRLPRPHHVYHIPHYLSYLFENQEIKKLVLLVLDGMSLRDWLQIKTTWKFRNPNWSITSDLLLAQLPSITSISRTALVSGLRPTEFLNNFETLLSQPKAWQVFWSKNGISETVSKLVMLSLDRSDDQLIELGNPSIQFWCLIDDTIDKLSHNAVLGDADQQASLRLWLDINKENNSLIIEKVIDNYLERGFSVFICSDHGHVEATGFGQPSEGLMAQTRGKRARIYNDRLAAERIQLGFQDTLLWAEDGLLPSQMTALLPLGKNAFAPAGEIVVTHGGASMEELIVPFIQIKKVNN